MVCGCKVPLDIYPETADWGPLFWKLLHGLAEYSGKQNDVNLQEDERRNWIQVFARLQFCIPCDICRGHYSQWTHSNPFTELKTIPYTEVGHWIRNWFFRLHNEINEGNDKPLFEESALSETYKNINIKQAWKALEPVMKRVISLNGISLMPWKTWLSYIKILQSIYGII
jgi:hypothetical protein